MLQITWTWFPTLVVKGMHFLTNWIIVPGYAITNYCFCINNQEEKLVKKNQQCQFLKKGTPTIALMRLLFITPLE
jgi:hypothetical protein